MNTNENTTNTENAEMSAKELAALFGGSNDLVGKASHRKAQITPLTKDGEIEYYRLRLPNAKCKMDVRGRVRVAMRAVGGLEAKGATKLIAGCVLEAEDETSKTYLVKVEAK